MSHAPDGWDIGGIVGGIVAVLGAVGAAIKWLWDRSTESRATREARIDAKEDEYVARLEKRLGVLEARVTHQDEELRKHAMALGILIAKVGRDDPDAPELATVARILGESFPLMTATPSDMIAAIEKLQGAGK